MCDIPCKAPPTLARLDFPVALVRTTRLHLDFHSLRRLATCRGPSLRCVSFAPLPSGSCAKPRVQLRDTLKSCLWLSNCKRRLRKLCSLRQIVTLCPFNCCHSVHVLLGLAFRACLSPCDWPLGHEIASARGACDQCGRSPCPPPNLDAA